MTPRQHTFCMLFVANGGNGTQAAIKAGYSPKNARTQAVRILADAGVKQRVAELQAAQAADAQVTADTLRAKFESCYNAAIALGQIAAAVSAQEKIAKLYGLLSDRVFVHETQKMTDAELVALIGGDDPAKRMQVKRLLASPDGFPRSSTQEAKD